MSQSNQDSGMFGVAMAVAVLVVIGGGFLAYQRMRSTQLALREVELARRMEKIEATKAAEVAEKAANDRRAALELTQTAAADQASSSTVLPPAQPAAEEEIRSKLATQQADWNKGDLDAFMKVYWKSDQLTFSSGGKVTRGWQATLDGYKSRYPTIEKIGKLDFGDLEFQQLDHSVMLVLGTWHLERGENSIGGNFSLVWKKFGKEWLIVHDHTSAKEK